MFLKIKLRGLLLKSFEGTRFGTNPYSLHPLANYIYYDAFNEWLPVLKMMKSEGASNEVIVEQFVVNAIKGVCPKKFEKAASSGESFKDEDLIDENIVSLVNDFCEGEEQFKSMMVGCVAGLRFGI